MKNNFNFDANWKKVAAPMALVAAFTGLAGCEQRASDIASRNLSAAADNFEVNRRVVLVNTMSDKYLLSVEGRCSFEVDAPKNKIDVTCQTGPKTFKKHSYGLSHNVTFFSEQLEDVDVNTYHYRVDYRPQSLVPDIRVHGDVGALKDAVTPGSAPAVPAPR